MLSSLFKKWHKSSPEASPEVSEESSLRDQIRDWQRVLAEEQGRLGQDLTELLATYERSLSYFAAHVHELDPVSLKKEYQSLEGIRHVLGNAIRRLEVSTKDDHELLEEWREWQALQELGKAALDSTQSQRQEMVRSELVIRGKLPAFSEPIVAASIKKSDAVPPTPAPPVPHLRTVFIEEAFDDLDDWQEIYHRELEAARPHWQERLEDAVAHADADPVYAAAIVARVRAWHGDRKRLQK